MRGYYVRSQHSQEKRCGIHDPASWLLGMDPREILRQVNKDACTEMFIAVMRWKQPRDWAVGIEEESAI